MIKSALTIALVSTLTALPATWIVRGPAGSLALVPGAIDLPAIGHRIEAYRALNGVLPSDWVMSGWASAFDDPWGRPYRFERHDGGVKLFTYGADGREGGRGHNADDAYWIITCESASAPATCLRATPR